MNKIIQKRKLADKIFLFEIEAPRIAAKRKPGQFVMVIPKTGGERIPLTIADSNPQKGTITLIVQEIGKTTSVMVNEFDKDLMFSDVVGPLGNKTEIKKVGTVLGIGGGVGIAPLYPILKGFKEAGNKVFTILGAKTKEFLILKDEMKALSDKLFICTDDGSEGTKGNVTVLEKEILSSSEKINEIITIGPAIMMKFAVETARPYNVPIQVSLNTIMIDGTGMCGGCRIKFDNKDKFVCVDGPEFDGYRVDFDGMLKRQNMYKELEHSSFDEYKCRLNKNSNDIGNLGNASNPGDKANTGNNS